MDSMHLLIHFLDLLDESLAVIGIIDLHMILFSPLFLLESFEIAVSAVAVHMP